MKASHRYPGCVLALVLTATAAADELRGTAYTVLFRGDPPAPSIGRPNARYPVAQGGTYSLYASSVQKTIAQAAYDPRLKGYLFSLPMAMDFPNGPICLVMKDARGTSLPVRGERQGDDGFVFHNALWEAEYARVRDLARSRAELRSLQVDGRMTREELDGGAATPEDPATCTAPPPQPEPPRPTDALSADDAKALAGGICAWKWQDRLGSAEETERAYRDAGLLAEWTSRAQAESAAKKLTALKINISDDDFERVKAGMKRGPGYLEHEEGVRRIKERTAACRTDVTRLSATADQRWEAEREAARNAPALALKQCQERRGRVKELQRKQADSSTREAELRQLIARLEGREPSATDSIRIDNASCKEF